FQGLIGPSPYFTKVPQAIRFILRYLWEMVLANLRVAYDVLIPGALPSRQSKLSTMVAAPLSAGRAFPGSVRAPLTTASFVSPGVVAIPLDARTDIEITML